MPPPGIEPGFRASHARVVVRSTTGTAIASARIRTRNAAFEAPHDHPFQHGGFLGTSSSEPVAGVEPATRRYEGRVMPTSPIGPNEKTPRPFRALGAESRRDSRSAPHPEYKD